MSDPQVEQLIQDLQDGDDRKRRAASLKLGRFRNPLVVPHLINAYKDVDSVVKQNALIGLGSVGNEDAMKFIKSVKPNITESELEFAKKELRAGKKRKPIVKSLTERGFTTHDAKLIFEMALNSLSEMRYWLARDAKKRMGRGLLIAIAALAITWISYDSAVSSPGGGTYLIWWGGILLGMGDFFAGFRDWENYR